MPTSAANAPIAAAETLPSHSTQQSEKTRAFVFDRHPLLVRLVEWQDRREADSLTGALTNASELIRSQAALALGSVQGRAAMPALIKALADDNAAVRRHAAFALGQLGTGLGTNESLEAAEKALLERWSTETDMPVRLAIVEALGKCGGQSGLLRLTNSNDLNAPSAPKILAAAGVLAIARLGLRKFMPPTVNAYCFQTLRRLDVERSSELAFAATYIFARAPVEQWRPHADALAILVSNKKYPAEAAANLARAFGKTKNIQYLPSLKTLAGQPDWRVRVECARAAGVISGTSATTAASSLLLTLSNDKSLHVKLAALSQLERLQPLDDKIVKVLKPRATAAGIDPRERGALLRAVAAQEALLGSGVGVSWIWKERERWKNEANLAFQRDVVAALGYASDSAVTTHLQDLVLVANNTSTDPKTTQPKMPSQGSMSLSAAAKGNDVKPMDGKEHIRAAQRKSILAADALNALHTAWQHKRLAGASSATQEHFKTLEQALNSADLGLMDNAAQALSDTLLLPFGSVAALVKRLEALQSSASIEPMQAIMRSLVQLKAIEGLPRITQLLQDSTEALAKSAADAFEALSGQRPQHRTSKPRAKTITIEQLRELWQKPVVHVTTRYGAFSVLLDVEHAPLTCLNFVQLAKQNKLAGVPFHRVVANFVVQGGDFVRGDGYGSPDEEIRSEFVPTPFERGVLGMASAGKDTEGSQYFVMHAYAPHLDGRYTAFGRVTEGMNVVDQIVPYDEAIDVKIAGK